MVRRLLNLLTALSLLLFVAVCVLWVRSYWIGSVFGYRAPPSGGVYGNCYLASYDGRLAYSRLLKTQADGQVGLYANDYPLAPDYEMDVGFAGFGYRSLNHRTFTLKEWRLPYWAPATLLAVPPAVALLRRRKSRRDRTLNLCPSCGYDLRATPDRCPECGASPLKTPG